MCRAIRILHNERNLPPSEITKIWPISKQKVESILKTKTIEMKKNTRKRTPEKVQREIKRLHKTKMESGRSMYTNAEIANMCGVHPSTVYRIVNNVQQNRTKAAKEPTKPAVQATKKPEARSSNGVQRVEFRLFGIPVFSKQITKS